MLLWHLQRQGAVDWRHGLTDQEAAEVFEGPAPGEQDVDGTRVWRTATGLRRKFLRNQRRHAAWRKFGTAECQPGGKELIWKWFAPLPDSAAAVE
jgi:hypothetical protein